MKQSVLVAVVCLAAAACSDAVPATTSAPEAVTSTTEVATTTSAAAAPSTTTTTVAGVTEADREAARTVTTLRVTGPEEVVFDWSEEACEPEHIPDITARAIRDADDQVRLYVAHYVTYAMVGADLDSVVTDCSNVIHESDFDADPSQYNDSEWLASPYTEDGQTVWAIVHNEYRGDTHGIAGQCPSNDRLTCLDTSMTMAKSVDGGRTFTDLGTAPAHLVATQPYPYDDEGRPTGFRQPSNIVPGPDGFYYVFSNVSEYPRGGGPWEDQWICAARTDDLDDPTSWRYWDGSDFTGRFVNPYLDPPDDDRVGCAPLAFPQLAASVHESIVWSDVLGAWVAVGTGDQPGAPEQAWGFYYATSENLIDWDVRRLLIELPLANTVADNANELYYAYPSLMDPDSPSRSFDTIGETAYLYLAKVSKGGNSLDRDLVRYPVETVTERIEPPTWTFDDEGGWDPTWDVSAFSVADGALAFESTGSDPYITSPAVSTPALGYGTVTIRMRVSAGRSGQLFFGTGTSPGHTEENSIAFALRPGDEFVDYVLDMGAIDGWVGTITSFRLDPTDVAGAAIEIDSITVSE